MNTQARGFGSAGLARQAFPWAILPIAGLILIAPPIADAQVVTNITQSGLNTQIDQVGNSYNITGGTRPGGGPNLFHSFGNFSVGAGDTANFFNESGLATSNILGRVTGGNISQIYGTIQTTDFGNANLFLMNPSGIVLGPGASLNVGGSVSFTTAQYIRLFGGAGSANFYANPANDGLANSILTIDPGAFEFLNAQPAAYGFLTSPDPNATITVQGSALSVPSGQSISLVGGKIVIEDGAQLSAPSGSIKLASTASPGEFDVTTLASLSNVDRASFDAMGTVTLREGTVLNVSGQLDEFGTPIGTGASGTVYIRSGQLVMDSASIQANTVGSVDGATTAVGLHVVQDAVLSNGAAISIQTSGAGRGGDVQITAGTLTLDGASIQSVTTGDGQGGNISIIDAQSVSLTNGAQVVSGTSGAGDGGNITVSATDLVSISGFDTTGALSGLTTTLFDLNTFAPIVTSGMFTTTSAGGNGGLIAVTAPRITVDNAGTVATINSGDGLGGRLALEGEAITLTNGAQLLTSTGLDYVTFTPIGAGSGGDVTLTGTDSILLSGVNPDLVSILTGSGASTVQSLTFSGSGNGGNITVNARGLAVTDGAIIQSQNFSPGIDVTGDGMADVFGVGGAVTVRGVVGTGAAESVTLSNGAQIASGTGGPGGGGDILITSDSLELYSGCELCIGASVNSVTGADGNGGNIVVNVGTLSLANASEINTLNFTGGYGQGGDVTIRGVEGLGSAAESVTVDGLSRITTQTWFGPGQGGDVNITANTLLINNGSVVTSDTFYGTGKGGDLALNVGNLTVSGGSRVLTSDSTTGFDGDLDGTVDPASVGAGGKLTIQGLEGSIAESVTLSGGALIGTQAQDGPGGDISISTSLLSLNDSSSMYTSTAGFGRGGNIFVRVQEAALEGGGSIASRTESFDEGAGAGGNITVQGLGQEVGSKADSLTLTGLFTGITSDSFGLGRPGDIEVHANNVSLMDQAMIAGGTPLSTGTGGKVTINAGLLNIAGRSLISSQSFAQAAGTVTITADNLTLDNGSILTSTASPVFGRGGDVILEVDSLSLANDSTINSSASSTGQAGDITITAQSVTVADGSSITASTSGSGDAGTIGIVATGTGVSLSGGTAISSSTTGAGDAGQVRLTTPTLTLNDATVTTSTSSSGNAGSITAKANSVTMSNGSKISSSSTGTATGSAGSITIEGLASPANRVTITDSSVLTTAEHTGRGGSITVDATTLALNNATLSASVTDVNAADSSDGPAVGTGNIGLSAATMTMTGGTISAATSGTRNAGTVNLNTGGLSLTNGTITTSTSGSGDAGTISLFATGNGVSLSGGSSISSSTTAGGNAGQLIMTTPTLTMDHASITTSTSRTGNAGSITANVGTMSLMNDATISSSSTAKVAGAGNAGNVTINASGAFTSNASTITTSAEHAKGGDILINAQNVQLSNGTLISASSNAPLLDEGAGDAGNIKMTSASDFIMQNSSITTEAAHASGGQVKITAPDMVQLVNSKLTTSVQGFDQDTAGGNISIDPQFVILQNSQILAQAFAGRGGAIDITAGLFLADAFSQENISASSTLGVSGTVQINAPINNLSSVVARLPESLAAVQTLLRAACAARLAQGETSSFVERGRDGIPAGPDGLLASPYLPMASGRSAHLRAQPSISLSGIQLRRLLGKELPSPVMVLSDHAACSS